LVRAAVERIREQILAGAYEPENLLPPEGKLGETLGVSRTVVREAMRMLAAQGLVEVSQGRRPRVRPADPETVVETFGTYLERGSHPLLDLIEVRRPLETEIAALDAQRATPREVQTLEEAMEAMTGAKTFEEMVTADIEFHRGLAQATGNPLFQLLLKTLAGAMRRSRQETLARTGIERALKGHAAILSAVQSRNPEAARTAMFTHLGMAEKDLRGTVS